MNQVSSSLENSTLFFFFLIHSYKFPNQTVTLFNNSVWIQEVKTKITSTCLAGRLTGTTLGSVRNNSCTAYRVEKFNQTPVCFPVRQIWKLPSIKSWQRWIQPDEHVWIKVHFTHPPFVASTIGIKCFLLFFKSSFKENVLSCAHISYSGDSKECKECNI